MMVVRRSSKSALRRFCLLQPEFLGCAKLKQAARGDVTCTMSYASGRDLSPPSTRLRMRALAYCKILRQPNSAQGPLPAGSVYGCTFVVTLL